VILLAARAEIDQRAGAGLGAVGRLERLAGLRDLPSSSRRLARSNRAAALSACAERAPAIMPTAALVTATDARIDIQAYASSGRMLMSLSGVRV
jgi:hypothetical protein